MTEAAVRWVPVLFMAMSATPLFGQQPRLSTVLDTFLVTVGDRLQLTVRVEHDPAETVFWPDSLALGPFELLGTEPLEVRREGGRTVTGVRLTLAAFELGDLEIPRFDVRVEAPDGSSATVSTDAYVVTVQSVGLDEGREIRAIRGPLGIPLSVIYVLPWLLLILFLGAVGFWLWRKRRPNEADARRPVDIPRLPHEEAYEALDRLAASDLLERGEVKEYHIILSEIVRAYIETRYGVFALEMTTGEVVESLALMDLPVETVRSFEGFADRCDLVKFAKLTPLPTSCREILAAARAFVDVTRPRVEGVLSGNGEVARDEVLEPAQVGGA